MANEFVVKNGLLVSGSATVSGSLTINQVASDPALGDFLVLAAVVNTATVFALP